MEATAQFEPDTRNVAAAREFLRDVLRRQGPRAGESQEVVVLLVSELVTNAITHAASPARLSVRVDDDAIWVGVGDDDPTVPTPVSHDTDEPGGLGLWLIDELAGDWGVEADGPDPGKIVWFTVPVATEPAAAPSAGGTRRSTRCEPRRRRLLQDQS